MSYKSIKGTVDLLPSAYRADGVPVASTVQWLAVESRIRTVFAQFDIAEIRTPVLEPTALIARGVGQMTDIVSKEMFAFERGDTHYVLRPEMTAPVMRAYMQHHLDQQGGLQRLGYIGPCFRAERPQRGRYRQFHQFGVELIGSEGPLADVETISVMMAIYRAFGIERMTLRLNNLGDADARPAYRTALQEYLAPYEAELSDTSRQRLAQNPLRILDTKIPREREIIADAPKLSSFIEGAAKDHFEAVCHHLSALGVSFVLDPLLVRGLDYYGRTAFELESPDLGAQSALAGGGRYDGLSQDLGAKKPIPAVGFAAGLERLLLVLDELDRLPPADRPLDVMLVGFGEGAADWLVDTAQRLREAGLSVGYDAHVRSLKAQMREAGRRNPSWVVISGADERASGTVGLKDMARSEQVDIPLTELVERLKADVS
jgi:histidyl-tRNA synthetase